MILLNRLKFFKNKNLNILKNIYTTTNSYSYSTKLDWQPKVCIVGSGPAALYTSQYILKHLTSNVNIDIYEKLPVPFGLVRYGVAPDHQDVKNVINSFTETIKSLNVQFYGNINIGHDIKINELLNAYDCVVLAYGSASENYLNVPGEKKFKNLISAKDFVGWYNGFPENKNFQINLKCKNALIIGAGNVALDIARILLSPIEKLKQTDISDHSMEIIKNENQIENVTIVARRGILNAAFTLKELRELTKFDIQTVFDLNDFKSINIDHLLPKLARPRRRLTEYMYKYALQAGDSSGVKKTLNFLFLHKPVEIIGNETSLNVEGVKFKQYKHDVDHLNSLNLGNEADINAIRLVDANEHATLSAGLVIRSIGFKNVNIDDSEVPFDKTSGIIPNDRGKVLDKNGLYCTGWIKRGPKGVIVDTTSDAHETANKLCVDLTTCRSSSSSSGKGGYSQIKTILSERNVQVVDKIGWSKIDDEEVRRGKLVGKPREKLSSVEEMLKVALS